MGIYIKDMEMPTSCKTCPFSDHQAWCLIPGDWRKRYYCPDSEVNEYCPLVPVADVRPVVRGRWELTTMDDGYGEYQLYKCNKCGGLTAQRRNYCHNCGADMREES